ncbi:hypothetical protein [Flavobacterium sp.]|uniref:hypothetical protein n=1 Tax=Flavobacterium sp. TaxID=239 RepID=UPI003F696B8F
MKDKELEKALKDIIGLDIYPYSPFEYIKLFINPSIKIEFQEIGFYDTGIIKQGSDKSFTYYSDSEYYLPISNTKTILERI